MTDLAARIRAARAYADLTQKELAARLGIDSQSVKRTEAGRRDPKEPELRAIAEETGVPRKFFNVGFARFDDQPDGESDGQLADHDRRMDEIANAQLALIRAIDERTRLLVDDLKQRALDPDSVPTPADQLDEAGPAAKSPASRPKREKSDSTGSQA